MLFAQHRLPQPECLSMHLFRSTRRCRERFTAEEDRLLIKQKETDALSWEKIAKFFPSTSPGTPQVRYCTKLKVRELAPKKKAEEGKEGTVAGKRF
jgi:hypothetical protein